MERFEIEDIVAQDSNGVVFRAHIRSSGAPVAIRRFFPFGKEGEGLEKEEGIAFAIAASRLASLNHPALRSVIEGSVDPIDGMPYLVSEWIEGETLPDVLKGEHLDPVLVIDVMRLALEVSLVLSKVLGEEALWVETDPESILVGNTTSDRGFTFWISPLKWLGSASGQRDLSELVKLGEGLAGWSNKLVSDQAGNGLGGWFKWLKENPNTGIRQAMESLASATGKEPPPADEILVKAATAKPAALVKQPTSKTPLVIVGAFMVLVLGMTLAYLHKTTQAPVIDDEIVKQEISEVIIVAEESAATETSDESPDGSAQVTNITEAPAPAPSAAPKPTSKFLSLSPDQIADIRQLDPGTLIELTGTLRDVIYIKPKETLVLDFEGTKGAAPIRGIIFKKGFKGPFSIASLKPYIGKQIIVRGISLTNKTKKSRDVSVRRFEDITLVQTPEEKPPESIAKAESEAAPDNPKLSPEDRETIEGLDNGTEVTLSGLFRSTRFSNTGKSLYLEFASQDRASVRGVIHQSDYPGTYTKEAFDELVGKTVTITGTVFKDNFNNPALVKVRSWDDIVKAP